VLSSAYAYANRCCLEDSVFKEDIRQSLQARGVTRRSSQKDKKVQKKTSKRSSFLNRHKLARYNRGGKNKLKNNGSNYRTLGEEPLEGTWGAMVKGRTEKKLDRVERNRSNVCWGRGRF